MVLFGSRRRRRWRLIKLRRNRVENGSRQKRAVINSFFLFSRRLLFECGVFVEHAAAAAPL